jgi:antibiotic biosynthesis monooxygenase (ABM) superfamily enzyme
MFMQIIQGKVKDADAVRSTMDRWLTDVQPGAVGWLGGTFGVSDDNQLIACVRFDSHESATANSNRPEQTAWWNELEPLFDGPVDFHDCDDVTLFLQGGSDEAGFVQVIQSRVRPENRARLLELGQQEDAVLSKYRPDVIGGTLAIDADGVVTETVSFTSEAEARAGEKQDFPPEVTKRLEEQMSLVEDVHFIDLHHPWFASAKRKK